MKATIPYIEQKFEEFNQQIFAGQLPKLPIELSDAKTFLGVCAFKTRKGKDGKKICYDFKLRINTRIDLPEEEIEDTIIHEMIHYFIGYNQLEDASAHGPMFLHMMNSINEKYGRHLTVSHKGTKEQNEQAIDTKQHWHVVAVIKFKDGRYGIKVLPRVQQRIVTFYNKVVSAKEVETITLYMSNNIYFNRFPNSAALNVQYVDIEEINENIKGADTLECNGKEVIQPGKEHNPSQPKQSKAEKPQWHVIAVITLDDGRCGVKILPRVLPSILEYYNGVNAFEEVTEIRLYMSNDIFFNKFPNSKALNYHIIDKDEVMEHLKNAEKMVCDGKTIKRHQK